MTTRMCENNHVIEQADQFYCPICRSVDLRTVTDDAPATPAAAPQASSASLLATGPDCERPRPASRPSPVAGMNPKTPAASSAARSQYAVQAAQHRLRELLTWGVGGGIAAGAVCGISIAAESSLGLFVGLFAAWVANLFGA